VINLGMVVREYICIDFSKNNEDYLFAGSTSGDFVAISIKSRSLASIIQVANSGRFLFMRDHEYLVYTLKSNFSGVW
jgi:hypothetical protein